MRFTCLKITRLKGKKLKIDLHITVNDIVYNLTLPKIPSLKFTIYKR